MNLAHSLLYSYPPHLMVESADYDGTNDSMARGAALTGIASSKSGILSTWIRIDGTDNTKEFDIFFGTTNKFSFLRTVNTFSPVGNSFDIRANNAAGTIILEILTNNAYTQSATWRHVLASWDLAASAINLYVNDVSDINATKTVTNDTIDYAGATDWLVGASGNKLNGCLAEFYFAPGQYLDFSVTNNRRKFITSSLKPVYLGKDGAGPTGTAPAIYLHLDPSEALADFATNRGAGGNFTITGSLTAGSTSPSDF